MTGKRKSIKNRLRGKPKYVYSYCNFDLTRLRNSQRTQTAKYIPALTPETQETRAKKLEIERYWYRRWMSSNPIIRHQKFNGRIFTLRLEDFQRLRDTEWLSFNLLEFMFNKVIQQHITTRLQRVKYFDSSLLQDIYDDRQHLWGHNLMRSKTFNHHQIGISFLNTYKHWVLVLLDFDRCSVHVMDSLNPRGTYHSQQLGRNLTSYFTMRKGVLGRSPLSAGQEWISSNLVGCRQQDTNNCGIFAIENCKLVLQNIANYGSANYSNTINPRRKPMLEMRMQLAKDILFQDTDSSRSYCSTCGLGRDRSVDVSCAGCARWYHLPCTNLQSMPTTFQCPLCD